MPKPDLKPQYVIKSQTHGTCCPQSSCLMSRTTNRRATIQHDHWKRLFLTVNKELSAKTLGLCVSPLHCMDVMMNDKRDMNNRKEREV